jgi:hypothetical protein
LVGSHFGKLTVQQDESFRTVAITPTNTVEDILDLLAKKLSLQDTTMYALYEVTDEKGKNTAMNVADNNNRKENGKF